MLAWLRRTVGDYLSDRSRSFRGPAHARIWAFKCPDGLTGKFVGRFWVCRVFSHVSRQDSGDHRDVAFFFPERYVRRTELAAIMGVSLATVDRMVAEGMPSVTWGRRTRRFRVSVAISWAQKRPKRA